MFPLSRVPFWYRFFEPQPGSQMVAPGSLHGFRHIFLPTEATSHSQGLTGTPPTPIASDPSHPGCATPATSLAAQRQVTDFRTSRALLFVGKP